jgi:predicted Fe-Mo cluster-binding NifX family protein
MKIAIPVDEKKTETSVCPSFGRAPYFLIYDLESKESLFVDNAAAASTGGAGIKAAQTLIDHQIGALLTPRLGNNAADLFTAAEIKIYKTIAAPAMENIEAFHAGKLSVLSEVHSGFHGRMGN